MYSDLSCDFSPYSIVDGMLGELKVNVDIDDKIHKIMIKLSDIAEWKVHVCVGGRGVLCVCV